MRMTKLVVCGVWLGSLGWGSLLAQDEGIEREYNEVDALEVRRSPVKYEDRCLVLKDKFLTVTDEPYEEKWRWVKRRRLSRKNYLWFRTSEDSSGLICYINRKKEKCVETIENLAEQGRFLLFGKLIEYTGLEAFFEVDKVVLGWEVKEEQGRIEMIITWPDGKKYRVTRSTEATLRCPHCRKPLRIEFQLKHGAKVIR